MSATERLTTRPGEVAAKVIDGEAILINLTTGLYYSLGTVGARVWALVEQGCTRQAIASAIAAEYDVDDQTAAAEVGALIDDLVTENLIAVQRLNGTQAPILSESPTGGVYQRPELKKFNDMAEIFAMDPPLPGLAKN